MLIQVAKTLHSLRMGQSEPQLKKIIKNTTYSILKIHSVLFLVHTWLTMKNYGFGDYIS